MKGALGESRVARATERIRDRLAWLGSHRLPMLVAVAVPTWILGAYGFSAYANGTASGIISDLYQSFQLFLGGFWHAPAPVPLPLSLQIARLVAPLVTLSALLATAGLVVRGALRRVEHRAAASRREHTVVIGLGERGCAAVLGLRRGDYPVVGVDLDPANPRLAGLRSHGVPVVTGDITTECIARDAALAAASHVIVLCGDDVTNVRVASSIMGRVGVSRKGTTKSVIAVHLSDSRLGRSIVEACAADSCGVTVESVNAELSSLARLLDAHPIPLVSESKIAVVGSGGLTTEFLVLAAKRHQLGSPGPDRLQVTLLAEGAADFAHDVRARYREIDTLLEITTHDVHCAGGSSPDWASGFEELRADAAPSRIYVVTGDDRASVSAALFAGQAMRGLPTEVIAALREPEAYAPMLGTDVATHCLLDTLFDPGIALGGTLELLARAIHAEYASRNAPAGTASHLGDLDWDALTEQDKDANRAQARDVPRKVAAAGCEVVPLTDWTPRATRIPPERVTALAKEEHSRWMRDRVAKGYSYGPVRVDTGQDKRHPLMVGWEQLEEAERQKDVDAVENIPLLLAMIGYRVGCRD